VFYVEIGVLTCFLSVVVTRATYYARSTTCLTGIDTYIWNYQKRYICLDPAMIIR
jgi:hypothetical protein